MGYTATISKISLRPHPNADRLQIGRVGLFDVIVNKDIQEGQLGVYFPPDGQVSEAFAKENNLISQIIDGKKVGYLCEKRRIKVLKLRGVQSYGLWLPISSLAFTGVDLGSLKEGDSFVELNGVHLCNKYYTEQTLRAANSNSNNKKPKIITKISEVFPKHLDTDQFRKNAHFIPVGSKPVVTYKLHGTSCRFGVVPIEPDLPWWKRYLLKVMKFFIPTLKNYDYLKVDGSRNVVLYSEDKVGYHGSEAFRFQISEPYKDKLIPGEIIYGEIVGYANGKPIMGSLTLKDMELVKQYGNKMVFSYGCNSEQCKLYVYRISYISPSGNIIEYSWDMVKQRCAEIGAKHVPELPVQPVFESPEQYLNVLSDYLEKPSVLDPAHIEEGLCIRWEHPKINILKLKCFGFLNVEQEQKDNSDNVDLEEVS